MTPQILRFGLIGVIGLLVDTGTLYAGLGCGLGFGAGRALSFIAAVLTTWLLNRRFTFRSRRATSLAREGFTYLVAMSLGGLLNLACYALIMTQLTYHPLLPGVAVAVGSLTGMLANYASAKWWVFRAHSL
jgi:putative flippase GtrA